METTTEWVERPWGRFFVIEHTPEMWVKTLVIREGARLSLQKHEFREEFWHAPEGGWATIGDQEFVMRADTVYHVPAGVVHRLENWGRYEMIVTEIAKGTPLEHDIIRLDDDYGREFE